MGKRPKKNNDPQSQYKTDSDFDQIVKSLLEVPPENIKKPKSKKKRKRKKDQGQ